MKHYFEREQKMSKKKIETLKVTGSIEIPLWYSFEQNGNEYKSKKKQAKIVNIK